MAFRENLPSGRLFVTRLVQFTSTRLGMALRCAAVLLMLFSPVVAGESVETERRFARLTRELAAEDFAVRRTAQEALLKSGTAAVPHLMEVARNGDSEHAARSVAILERLLASTDPATAQMANSALEELADPVDGDVVVAREAQSRLTGWQSLREQRAVQELVRQGAKVDIGPDMYQIAARIAVKRMDTVWTDEDEAALLSQCVDAARHPELKKDRPTTVGNIILNSDWTGGREGLNQLKRLGGLTPVLVFVVNGSDVTAIDVREAASGMANVSVEERGPSLGVRSDGNAPYCEIGQVLPGSAAAAAGVQAGDVIESVNGESVRDFQELIRVISRQNTGDEVRLSIHRRGTKLELAVKLGDWTEVDTASSLWASPRITDSFQRRWIRSMGIPK